MTAQASHWLAFCSPRPSTTGSSPPCTPPCAFAAAPFALSIPLVSHSPAFALTPYFWSTSMIFDQAWLPLFNAVSWILYCLSSSVALAVACMARSIAWAFVVAWASLALSMILYCASSSLYFSQACAKAIWDCVMVLDHCSNALSLTLYFASISFAFAAAMIAAACALDAATWAPFWKDAPAPARFVTHCGTGPTPSSLQKVSAKMTQLRFKRSYCAPCHSSMSFFSFSLTSGGPSSVSPIGIDSR